MNLTNSNKATIVKIDNGTYHSFNAYKRPVRVKSDFRCHPRAKVVNLDPTDDPSEVCKAYRAIQIKDQLKRIAKNEKRLAEQRRKADEEAAAAKARAELKMIKRRDAQRAYRENSSSANRRKNILMRMTDGGFLVAPSGNDIPNAASLRNSASLDICMIRQMEHADIVSITSAGLTDSNGSMSVSLWGLDTFKRPPASLYTTHRISNTIVLKKLILDALSAGYVVQVKDINAAITSIRGVVSTLRKEGFVVCTVRNSETDVQARGWIIPSAQNGITKDVFFSMSDALKA